MSPFEVLRLIVSKLQKLNIPYMVGGSFASAAHGIPRSTLDADLIVDLKPQHARGLVDALGPEFYVDMGRVEEAIRLKRPFNIIHLESFFKADLFVLGNNAFAREEFSRRRPEAIGGEPEGQIYVATPEDTVLAKLEWYRRGAEVSENQWRDVLGILKIQSGRLNVNYMRKWAAELGVSDLLERVLQEAGNV